MPKLIQSPTVVKACGNLPKQIEEFVGRVNSNEESISVARMVSPCGWKEPGQRPEFQETSVVLKGTLVVQTEEETFEVKAGQAVVTEPGEWVCYSTPGEEGAEYIAICTPAFSPDVVHRDIAEGGICGFVARKN
ncbi:MAG: cupin domain-containing protein [Pirellulales bacterium]